MLLWVHLQGSGVDQTKKKKLETPVVIFTPLHLHSTQLALGPSETSLTSNLLVQ